jgi:zinc/manganese transport system substrate-binding protein
MKRFLSTLTLFALALAAQAKLNVVATLPDFGSIAEHIGGEYVKVTSIARGTEDPHFVDARPSYIRVLNQADVLIEGGAELEIGWLPPLVNSARNSKILGDAPGHVILSRGLPLLEVPAGAVDRSMGDVHPLGNPHYWLDPANAEIVTGNILEALARVDPANAADYEANRTAFLARLAAKRPQWEAALAPLRGVALVAYHNRWAYFARRFRLDFVGTIEPRPGVPPSPAHLAALIATMKARGVKMVVRAAHEPEKNVAFAAQKAGAAVVVLADSVGGLPAAGDYIALFDANVAALRRGAGLP